VGRRFEVATIGIDDALQGLSTDPFGSTYPSAVGLRIPAFTPSSTNRYLFLLASRGVSAKESVRLRGWRQLLKIGVSPTAESVPSRPIEFEVTTPDFRFPDGNVSWHLVREPEFRVVQQRPNTDLPNFAFGDTDTPALLYQTATFSAVGGVGYYMVGMTGYTPPTGRRASWEPIAGLGNMHDLRAQWRSSTAWDSLDEYISGPCRVSLYATVLQTNPQTRPDAVFPSPLTISGGVPPEEAFITNMKTGGGEVPITGVIYWRIAGALMFEDEDKLRVPSCP
jgi:hypothetical protein